ncbi:MAG: hypothetical protein IH989_02635 [Planctomycetes bacterium]|nr:hypothetical protein [Planctomycetota bacterium]
MIAAYLGYYLLRQNITAVISNGIEILAIDESLLQLEKLAHSVKGSSTTTPAFGDSEINETMSTMQKRISDLVSRFDELLAGYEQVPLKDTPGPGLKGDTVKNPKAALLEDLRRFRNELSAMIRQTRDSQAVLVSVARQKHATVLARIQDQQDELEQLRSQIGQIATSLGARCATMTAVLEKFVD